jgi:hypothetical protein
MFIVGAGGRKFNGASNKNYPGLHYISQDAYGFAKHVFTPDSATTSLFLIDSLSNEHYPAYVFEQKSKRNVRLGIANETISDPASIGDLSNDDVFGFWVAIVMLVICFVVAGLLFGKYGTQCGCLVWLCKRRTMLRGSSGGGQNNDSAGVPSSMGGGGGNAPPGFEFTALDRI